MSLIRQTFKVFSNKIFIHLIIIILLFLVSITVYDGIVLHQKIKSNLDTYKAFENENNFLYIHSKDLGSSEIIFPEDLSYNPIIHKVQKTGFRRENISYNISLYDETILSKCNINLVKGKMPILNDEYLEVLSTIDNIGYIYDVPEKDYKLKVVGVMNEHDSIIGLSINSSDSIEFYKIYSSVERDFDCFNTHYIVGIQDPNLELSSQRNCILEYDKDIYQSHKTEILNELEQDYRVTSLGEQYRVLQESVKKNIVESVLIGLGFIIVLAIFMFIMYYNLFSIKSNIIGIHYLVGFSSKRIGTILGLLSIIHLVLYSVLYFLDLSRWGQLKICLSFLISYGVSILIIFLGYCYMLIRFKKSSITNLLKNEGEE